MKRSNAEWESILYSGRLYNFVYRFVGDQGTAEDIVQETSLKAFSKQDDFKEVASFSTWVFAIAGNLAKTELTRRKKWKMVSMDQDEERGTGSGASMDFPDKSPYPNEVAESSLADSKIRQAINSLPDIFKQVILLYDIEGMSYRDVSSVVGCPMGTIKSRLYRARSLLQEVLKNEGRDVGITV